MRNTARWKCDTVAACWTRPAEDAISKAWLELNIASHEAIGEPTLVRPLRGSLHIDRAKPSTRLRGPGRLRWLDDEGLRVCRKRAAIAAPPTGIRLQISS
jgi:hypothetical protein